MELPLTFQCEPTSACAEVMAKAVILATTAKQRPTLRSPYFFILFLLIIDTDLILQKQPLLVQYGLSHPKAGRQAQYESHFLSPKERYLSCSGPSAAGPA